MKRQRIYEGRAYPYQDPPQTEAPAASGALIGMLIFGAAAYALGVLMMVAFPAAHRAICSVALRVLP
jgi:hypothetical protein